MRIIDNKREKLANVLNKEFSKLNEIAIASAYFNIRGYGSISKGLEGKPLKLLLGREPTETIKWEDEVLRELEEFEDDSEYFKLLQATIDFFKDDKRYVRIIEGRFFHGKAFLAASPNLEEVDHGVAVVGSSNFTYGGLVSNRELNMINTDREAVQELADWFREHWKESRDFKEEFIQILSNYVTSWSAYEIVAKALYEAYKGSLIERDRRVLKSLFVHQQLSYIDAMEKLSRYGGVIIADSTGLGKTSIALAIAHEKIREGIRPLIIAPKAILDTTWKEEMRRTRIMVETLSMEKLSQNPDVIMEYIGEDGPKLIIVDEAHYFRRPTTNRYMALQELITKNDAEVVLMTATPINTSLLDLYSLMKLYLPDDAIADMGHDSLYKYFLKQQRAWLNGEPINMDDVLRRFVVRHSRELAKALDREGRIKFPERVFDDKVRRYEIKISLPEINEKLDELKLPVYDLSIERLSERFTLPDGTKISGPEVEMQKENLKKLVKIIFKINLFKRLESSFEAFRKTLERLRDYITLVKKYAEDQGIFIPPRMKGDITRLIDDEEDGVPSEELLRNIREKFGEEFWNKIKLSKEEVNKLVEEIENDLGIIDDLLGRIWDVEDSKYFALEERLEEIIKDIEEPNGVLIFTQYTDTASYLYRNLRNRFKNKVILITGSGGYDPDGRRIKENEGVALFRKIGGILISTDVLSAGQNIQNAQYVVNYDFPWNPVIIIQRVGRVDRIGSPYDKVFLINMFPRNGDPDDPESLEYFLSLMQKLYTRLEAIRETIGLDASTLGEEAKPKDFSVQLRIAKGDKEILKLLEKRIEQFVRDPIDVLAKIINEKGIDWVKKIPNGIGAIKDSPFEGLFVLFTDGNEFFWRLHNYDTGEIITSPTEIVDLLLSGDYLSKGERIKYEKIVPKLREAKDVLKKEFERAEMVRITKISPEVDRKVKTIFNELAKRGDEGERLAAKFRKLGNNRSIVEQLWRAYRKGRLLEEARDILNKLKESKEVRGREVEKRVLKRVCWCYFRSSRKPSISVEMSPPKMKNVEV